MIDLRLGDCLDVLRTLPEGSVDAVVTDPPYPCIKRSYGVWTEAEWFSLINPVVEECRRVLKPRGSAVFILQPNSERVGRMRTWLWEFMAKWGKEWGIVQDAWWWNHRAIPTVHCQSKNGLMRPSLKACVWLGNFDCHRNQEAILTPPAESSLKDNRRSNSELKASPSGQSVRHKRALCTMISRGGATPFNVMRIGNGEANKHPASTPFRLASHWVKYICPADGVCLDPFMGSGTTGVACVQTGRHFIGVEIDPGYFEIARKRIEAAQKEMEIPLYEGVKP